MSSINRSHADCQYHCRYCSRGFSSEHNSKQHFFCVMNRSDLNLDIAQAAFYFEESVPLKRVQITKTDAPTLQTPAFRRKKQSNSNDVKAPETSTQLQTQSNGPVLAEEKGDNQQYKNILSDYDYRENQVTPIEVNEDYSESDSPPSSTPSQRPDASENSQSEQSEFVDIPLTPL